MVVLPAKTQGEPAIGGRESRRRSVTLPPAGPIDHIVHRRMSGIPVVEMRTEEPAVAQEEQQQQQQQNGRSSIRVAAILVALLLSLFIAALDSAIVATAIPVIAHDLDSASGYLWIGAAYTLAAAAASPIWGKLSDIWGRKVVFLTALAVFLVGSLMCALARNMSILIAGRTVQGSSCGGLILMVNICISDMFSMRMRSLIVGLTEVVWAVAGLGPLLGGVFTTLLSWRWCFWINIPICGLAFILIFIFLDIRHEHTSLKAGVKAIDWFGIALFLGFTLLLLLGLDFGGVVFPWNSAKIIALLVAGSCMVVIFLYSEKRLTKHPLIPLEVFNNKSNVACFLVTFFHSLLHMNAEYYLPLFFQSVYEATPLRSGILVLPLILPTAAAGIITGIFMHRTGIFREIIWLGSIFLCLGNGLLIKCFSAESSLAQTMGYQVIAGTGSGLLFIPLMIAVQTQVQQKDVASATSTLSFIRTIALAIAVVIGGVVFQNSMDNRVNHTLIKAGLSPEMLEKLSGRNAAANVMLASTLSDHPAQELAVRQAFAWSIRNMWIMFSALGFVAVVSSFFVRKSDLSHEHTETVTGLRAEKQSEELRLATVTCPTASTTQV